MAELQIHQFFCRSDNFGVLIHDEDTGMTAAVDTPDATAISRALGERGWSLTHILTTHHHADHTAGHAALKSETGCVVIGPKKEADRIPGIDEQVEEGTTFDLGGHQICVLETPGHTLGHVAYWLPDDNVVFVGDTLFSLGCGRLFEADGATMWESLKKLMALPKETLIYCGHEYSKSNAAFALSVEPNNESLQQRALEINALREQGLPTLPVALAAELAQNPFLRPDNVEIQEHLAMIGHPLATIFSELRRRKDSF